MLGGTYNMQAIVWDCINRRGDLYQYTVTYNVGIYGWMVLRFEPPGSWILIQKRALYPTPPIFVSPPLNLGPAV